MNIYFNDNEKFIVPWLSNLFPGAIVDGQDIQEVMGTDVVNFDRVHLFAGIGGWEYALQLAGWPDSMPVWTGSCPCQPFSVAGRQRGTNDERNLWPEFRRLINECRPSTIFGEQVTSQLGLEWLVGVHTDLETMGYAFAAADLCAAGVGAPHIRQRLYWVAYTKQSGLERHWSQYQLQSNSSQEQTYWSGSSFVTDIYGKDRRIESSLEPLAYGVSNRVGRIRAYGGSIVPQVAAVFIRSFMEATGINSEISVNRK